MTKITSLSLLAVAAFAWASDVPIERSSHPRGFASGGSLPPMTTQNGSATVTAGGVAQDTSTIPGKATQSGRQATSGGVAVTGATRIEARVNSRTASAVGDQNTAGNRVGGIGGK